MSMTVNPNSNIPMYKQLIKIISEQIRDGTLKSGDRLPSENSLMKQYGVSRITIRAAIAELVDDGLLIRSQGKGTFVSSPKRLYNADDHVGFSRSCILSGKVPSTKLLTAQIIYPTMRDMAFFNIRENDLIVMTQRLRYVDGEPTLIETNHYSDAFRFLLEENLEGSLFELLENKYRIPISSLQSIRTLEVCISTGEEARLLGVKKNTPLLLFKDKHKDSGGKPLFTSKQVYCTERLKFYL